MSAKHSATIYSIAAFCLLRSSALVAGTYTCSNLNDAGAGSLRQAILDANAAVGSHTINFSTSGKITLESGLPSLTKAITIDGTTATGASAGVPTIEIDGATLYTTIIIATTGSCVLNSICINRSSANGIYINNAGSNTIKGCYIGTTINGTAASLNAGNGIFIFKCDGNTIGGTTSGERNVISGNRDDGIYSEATAGNYNENNTISGNYIGTDKDGTAAVSNGIAGIQYGLNCKTNMIGGTTASCRNVISGNSQYGIWIFNNSDGNTVQNNYIGVDKNGNTALPNGRVASAATNHGVFINYNCNDTQILNNVISGNGTAGGTLPSTYGGPDTWTGTGDGIACTRSCPGTIIKGNSIGVGADGTTSVPNQENGIYFGPGGGGDCTGAIIGSGTAGEANVICSHPFHAIVMNETTGFTIKGNFIGTDAGATLNLGNQDAGIVTITVTSGTIGGTAANEGNVIVNSKENYGLQIQDSDNLIIKGNYIGTNNSGANMGNLLHGIFISQFGASSTANVIGAAVTTPVAGEANTIAYNGSAGVFLNDASCSTNKIRGNSIYCNGGPGINLNGLGNTNIAAPPITSSTTNAVSGTAASNTNLIHVYRNSTSGTNCNCEGEIYVGTTTVASLAWTLTHNLGLTDDQALYVTATQTTSTGNTSPFYACTSVTLPVELLSFTAKKNEERNVLLEWATASEINNDFFEVQRSTNGFEWKKIGRVNGAGNTSRMIQYSFIDETPEYGENYYRLKQTDFDGTEKITVALAVKFNNFHISIFPNPASEVLNIRLITDVAIKQELKIQLTDQYGKIVYVSRIFSNDRIISIPVPPFSDGIYFVSVITSTDSYSEKLFINTFKQK